MEGITIYLSPSERASRMQPRLLTVSSRPALNAQRFTCLASQVLRLTPPCLPCLPTSS